MKNKRLWPIYLFSTAFIICSLVFYNALPLLSALQAPDAGLQFTQSSLLRRMLPWMNGSSPTITHDTLLQVLPPLVYHELSFIVSTALLALAMGTYLRLIGLPVLACFAGGLAMAFSGYHFTLFHAGHRGYFIMMPYALFLFALVERCLTRPRWFHFALIPACAVCGLSTQPDVFAMIVMLLAVYTVFRLIQVSRAVGIKTYFVASWKKLAWGIVVTAVTFLVLGAQTVSHLINVTLASREQQLAQATAGKPDSATKTAEETQAEKHSQWIFATNWSLPPEDTAEFIAPCLRGLDTGNPKGPYWGRLGQSEGWEKTHEGFANFRQHTIYLGVMPCAFAVFAVIIALSFRCRKHPHPASSIPERDPFIGLTFFWAAAAVICLLLALGRYAPLYRLFYEIPIMDKVRGPAKFVHLVEISVSVLFALGLTWLIRPVADEDYKRFRLSGRLAMVLAIFASATCLGFSLSFNPHAHASTWSFMGIPAGTIQTVLTDLYKGALMRAGWLFALAAAAIGAVALAKPEKRKAFAWASAILVMIVSVFDMAEVGNRFATVDDVAYKYARSPVVDALVKKGKPDGSAYSYLQLTNQLLPGNVPFLDSIGTAGITCLDPQAGSDQNADSVKTYLAFEKDVVKRWKYWGAAIVFAPPSSAAEMARSGLATLTGLYDIDQRRMQLVTPASMQKAQVATVAPQSMIPSVAVFHGWRTAAPEKALSVLAESDFDMDQQIVVSGEGLTDTDTSEKYTPASWVKAPSDTRGNRAIIHVQTNKPGLLFMRDYVMREFKTVATVNGKKAPVYQANGLFQCVPVGAGESTVVIAPYVSTLHVVGAAAALAFVLFALVSFIRDERRAPSAN